MLLGSDKNTRPDQSLCIYLDPKNNTEDVPLERMITTKFLGIQIDQNITWKEHVDQVIKTCSRNVGIINKLKHILPTSALYTLYCSLIMPYMNYGILAWGNACSVYINRLFKVQKRALRIISNSHYRSSTNPLLIKFDVLSVKDMYNLELGTFMFKFNNNLLPNTFDDLFTKQSDIHVIDTRHKDQFRLPLTKKVFCEKSIRFTGIRLWNGIDSTIKESLNVKHFRSAFKSHLMKCYT